MSEALLLEINEKLDVLNKKIDFASKEVFNADEAAEYLTISYYTITRLARIGAIEHARNGKNYVFKKMWLDNWIEDNKKA